jgi:glycine/D-amino acid oxidase-like deaminating enzyme
LAAGAGEAAGRGGGSCRGGLFLLAAARQGRRGHRGQGRQLEQGTFLQVSHVISLSWKEGEESQKLKKARRKKSNYAAETQNRLSCPGVKRLAEEPGMLTRIHAGLREISASTTMVAR